jgi:hypothetical protein
MSKDGHNLTHLAVLRESKNLDFAMRVSELKAPRQDLLSPEQFLQLAIINFPLAETFIPHIHLDRELKTNQTRTLESWVILKGKVQSTLYDMRKNELGRIILNEGEILVTISGGHNYLSLQSGTTVAEFKSGPFDAEFDKERF